jgi:hypothetical protein
VCGRFCQALVAEAVIAAKVTAHNGAKTTITATKIRTDVTAIKELLRADNEFLKPLIQTMRKEVLEAEMAEALGTKKGSGPTSGKE